MKWWGSWSTSTIRWVELDPEQLTNVKPALAKSWDISPDGKTLTFHLRDDVKFHSATR